MSAAEVATPIDHVKAIQDAWRAELMSEQRTPGGRRDYIYASGRRDCVRRMALDLSHPEDDSAWPESALERMRRGSARERDVVAILAHVGQRATPRFEVIEAQRRFEVRDRDGALLIVGKMDGRLKFADGATPIFEVKSGDAVRHADSLEDLDRSPWTKHHVDQLLAYLLADEEEWGLLILDKPEGPTFLRVNLFDHLERAESFLRDARTAIDARFDRAPLPVYTQDASECRRCPHLGKSCAPPIDYGSGVSIITDPGLIQLAEVREATRDAHKSYEAADKRLKEALRGVTLALMGDYQVSGKWVGMNKTKLPDAIKAQYTEYDPEAQFRLTIDRVAPPSTP